MTTRIQTYVTSLFLLLISSSISNAAFISAQVSTDRLQPTESAQISMFLNLISSEESSVVEGKFKINGLGNVADVTSLTEGGPSWPNSFGNIDNEQLLLSLTSDNDSAPSRQIAVLDVLALTPGVFEVVYDADTFASFDIDVSPFVQNLPLSNIDGDVLARITVVPIPPALTLFIPALGSLSLVGYRRHKTGNHGRMLR